MIKITDSEAYTDKIISEDMFGLNLTLTYDMEFLVGGAMLDLLGDLKPKSLRYPGGAITEIMFSGLSYGEFDWAETYFASIQNDLTQRENLEAFIKSAASINSSVQLVLPTRIAFTESAGQALQAGQYGKRTSIDPEYFKLLEDYIDEAILISKNAGTAISHFEIGNEFWGSGRMTATEYGYLAAEVTNFLDRKYTGIDILAQVSYNAGVFSPLSDTKVFLVDAGNDFDLYFPFQELDGINGLQEYIMPGQGSGVRQTQQIALEFAKNPQAIAALDGIVDHVYFRRGFAGIDGERDHALKVIPKVFREWSGSGAISTYITEWSVRHKAGNRESEDTNHLGLQYASSTLEAFFELAAAEISGANFWPVTFGNEAIDRRVLIDTSESDYTFGGEVFRLLSQNLVGLSPEFDFEVEGKIDVHGFSSDDTLVFFISERSGESSIVPLDFSNFWSSSNYFVDITYLGETGDTGIDVNADPVLTYSPGYSVSNSTVEVDLDPWSLAMVRLQEISELSDLIDGSNLDDVISGRGGNDNLSGNRGNDTLLGGSGNDTLNGGWGNDNLFGGDDNDLIIGNFGNNTLQGGLGDDTLRGSDGDNYISGGFGNDLIEVKGGTSYVQAGDGDDSVFLLGSRVKWHEGAKALNISSSFQMGTEEFADIGGYSVNQNTLRGGDGWDSLFLTQTSDALFLDDDFSKSHPLESQYDIGFAFGKIPRVLGFEAIYAGDGDDIVDLTSARFSQQNTHMEIFGQNGDDILWGSDGNELISGGKGNDTIFGGGGADSLYGGAGADQFEFSISGDIDVIHDFDPFEGDSLAIFVNSAMGEVSLSWGENSLSFDIETQDADFRLEIMIDNLAELVERGLYSEEWNSFFEIF